MGNDSVLKSHIFYIFPLKNATINDTSSVSMNSNWAIGSLHTSCPSFLVLEKTFACVSEHFSTIDRLLLFLMGAVCTPSLSSDYTRIALLIFFF